MKVGFCLFLMIGFFGFSALADFGLSQSSQSVVCYGEDNQSLILNGTRTGLKYSIDGESYGMNRIIDVTTDNKTFISYTTSEVTLTLSNDGDSFIFEGDQESQSLTCK